MFFPFAFSVSLVYCTIFNGKILFVFLFGINIFSGLTVSDGGVEAFTMICHDVYLVFDSITVL